MRLFIHRALIVALTAAVVVLPGCGDDSGDSAAATTARSSAASADAFPVTVAADQGTVTIDARPQRIVSLSASLTEMLYAVGADDQVVAVDKYSNYPDATPVTDLSGLRPNIEGIASFEPDLVVVANDREGVVAALANLDVPTLVLGSADSVDDVYREIKLLGEATGHRDAAADLIANMRDDLDKIVATRPERDAPLRYYFELSDTYHSATSDTFIGGLLGLVSLTSIADGAEAAADGYPQLSAEYILDADPDVIFLAHTTGDSPSADAVASRPGWDRLRAVRSRHVVVLDADIAARWGPRIVDLLRTVAGATREVAPG